MFEDGFRRKPHDASEPYDSSPWGELVDKITILEIKETRLSSGDAVGNVKRELEALQTILIVHADNSRLMLLKNELKDVNRLLH